MMSTISSADAAIPNNDTIFGCFNNLFDIQQGQPYAPVCNNTCLANTSMLLSLGCWLQPGFCPSLVEFGVALEQLSAPSRPPCEQCHNYHVQPALQTGFYCTPWINLSKERK